MSHQAHNLTELGIASLLEKSRSSNSSKEITGLLIFFDGIFTQYLEGPENAIDKLYKNILKDSRHDRIIELDSGFTDRRYYGEWTMAYESLSSDQVAQRTGFKKIDKLSFLEAPSENFNHPGIDLLESFIDNLRI